MEVHGRKRDRKEYLTGLRWRNHIFHRHFGGPQPQEAPVLGHRGGRGAVRGTGRGAGKGGRL